MFPLKNNPKSMSSLQIMGQGSHFHGLMFDQLNIPLNRALDFRYIFLCLSMPQWETGPFLFDTSSTINIFTGSFIYSANIYHAATM